MKRWNVAVQASHTQLVTYTFAVEAASRPEAEALARAQVRADRAVPTSREPVRKQLLTSYAVEQEHQEALDA